MYKPRARDFISLLHSQCLYIYHPFSVLQTGVFIYIIKTLVCNVKSELELNNLKRGEVK